LADTLFHAFGGLDFSGAKEPLSNLWTAVGVPANDKLVIIDLRPHAFREDAALWIQGGFKRYLPEVLDNNQQDIQSLWGFDFPLSLPSQAAENMWPEWTGHWPELIDRVSRELPKDFALLAEPYGQTKRACDTGSAMAPLNIRLIKQTHEGLRVIEALRRDAGLRVLPFDSEPGPLTAIEVYPSQTAKDLGLRGRRPSRPGDGPARPAQLSPHIDFAHPAIAATCGTIEDAWDAVLACLTAYLVKHNLDQPTQTSNDTPHNQEGWIYRHPQALG